MANLSLGRFANRPSQSVVLADAGTHPLPPPPVLASLIVALPYHPSPLQFFPRRACPPAAVHDPPFPLQFLQLTVQKAYHLVDAPPHRGYCHPSPQLLRRPHLYDLTTTRHQPLQFSVILRRQRLGCHAAHLPKSGDYTGVQSVRLRQYPLRTGKVPHLAWVHHRNRYSSHSQRRHHWHLIPPRPLLRRGDPRGRPPPLFTLPTSPRNLVPLTDTLLPLRYSRGGGIPPLPPCLPPAAVHEPPSHSNIMPLHRPLSLGADGLPRCLPHHTRGRFHTCPSSSLHNSAHLPF